MTADRLQINASEINRQISLRSNTRVPNGRGGYTVTPTDSPPIWSKVEPLEGREQLIAMQSGIERPHRFTFRYADAPDVTAISQIVAGARVFDVKSVVDVSDAHVKLIVLAEELEPEAAG